MRRSGPWASTGLLALALALGTGPASAATTRAPALVSPDAEHWSTSLEAPLFDQTRRWVPGDTQTLTLWVRNPTSGAAVLVVSPLTTDGRRPQPADLDLDLDLDRAGLDLEVRVDGRPARLGADLSRRLVGTTPARVELTATLPAASGNTTQRQRHDLRVAIRLDQQDPPPGREASAAFGPGNPNGLSVPVAGRHVSTNGALPVGVPLTLAAIALALRAARRKRPSTRPEEDRT